MKKIVVLPGGYHPYHAGHYSLYKAAEEKFPDADIYLAATNDTKSRPFPFEIKKKLAQLAGVNPDQFVQVKSPFSAEEITSRYDPDDTVLIFVKSEKNAKNGPDPEGPFPAEVDPNTGKLPLVTRGPNKGKPVSDRLQYYKGNENNLQPMSRHSYLDYLPTVEFGPGFTSASDIRKEWPTLDDAAKLERVMSLYPKTQQNKQLADVAVKMLDAGIIGDSQVTTETKIHSLIEKIALLKEHMNKISSDKKQKMIPLLQESISVLRKLKENDGKEEKIKSLDIDRKSANLTSDETKVFQKIIRMYPEASDPLSAILKYVIHSIEQSDSEDYHHEKRLSAIEKNIRKLEKEVDTFHSKDDLTEQEVEEATLINDPEQGHLIVPDGGMGTWDEKSLLSNLIRKFSSMAEMIKEKRYSNLYHSLYEAGVVENMLKALIQYENFKEKQGNRPIAKGKKIELKEIDFSSGLDDRNFSVKKILEIGKVVGQIEGYDVVKATAGSQEVYFLVSDDNVHSLIGFDNGYLKNIKNVSKQSGVVRALLGYLVHIQKQPIEISHTEPLTSDGLSWVIHLIEKPRGLVITNQDNEPINVEELKNEWDQAKETGNPGTTSITITEDTKFGNKIRTNESYRHSDSLLMPFIFYTKNQDYLTEK